MWEMKLRTGKLIIVQIVLDSGYIMFSRLDGNVVESTAYSVSKKRAWRLREQLVELGFVENERLSTSGYFAMTDF